MAALAAALAELGDAWLDEHHRIAWEFLVVTAERVYFQCPKALVRSELWNPEKHVSRKALPSTGTILADVSSGTVGGVEYDRAYPERLRTTLY